MGRSSVQGGVQNAIGSAFNYCSVSVPLESHRHHGHSPVTLNRSGTSITLV